MVSEQTIGKKGKANIIINPQACTECLACQLACSFTYTGSFNLEKARIVIRPPEGLAWERKISFTDDCIENCILCTRYCVYEAIVPKQ